MHSWFGTLNAKIKLWFVGKKQLLEALSINNDNFP
jgi:hypothetical protein